MADKNEEKKKKRIKGKAFWKLKDFEKKIRDFQEELSEWEINKAEELELYPDQINWNTGAIFDPNAEIKNNQVLNGLVIGRLEHKTLREHKNIIDKVKLIDKEMIEFRDKLANKLEVWPDMIDLKTGVIENDVYESIDPDMSHSKEKNK